MRIERPCGDLSKNDVIYPDGRFTWGTRRLQNGTLKIYVCTPAAAARARVLTRYHTLLSDHDLLFAHPLI